jgi:hypothetical protein
VSIAAGVQRAAPASVAAPAEQAGVAPVGAAALREAAAEEVHAVVEAAADGAGEEVASDQWRVTGKRVISDR